MTENYIGSTNIKSELTKHLFGDFRKAYWHFKDKIQATRLVGHEFVVFIEGNFDITCDGEGH